jgi:hypothetical protein
LELIGCRKHCVNLTWYVAILQVRGGHVMGYNEDKIALVDALKSQIDNAKAAATEE